MDSDLEGKAEANPDGLSYLADPSVCRVDLVRDSDPLKFTSLCISCIKCSNLYEVLKCGGDGKQSPGQTALTLLETIIKTEDKLLAL